MEFRVLGPLEVRAGDESLPLGTPAERHLLAILLVLANETVSTDRLVDELWGDDPPPTARNMVQRYVSRLRRGLRDPGGERLVTEPHGYRIRVEAGELDSGRFAQLVAAGRESTDPATAAACFGEALDLWRGPPLHGTDAGPTVSAERTRWEEARLGVLEERIEADLAGGRHGALVGELQRLAQQFPLRERLWRQLMVALHRSGRQAEALRAYAAYRERIAEEAGLEPSEELSRLEEQILLGDPNLAAPEIRPRFDESAGGGVERPLGTVAFLFTDIVGSTPRWEENRPDMSAALAHHDDVLRAAIESHGGWLFKHTGDGVVAAFSSPTAAIAAAVAAQRKLELPVRMGIATGEAELRGEDYFGPPLNQAALIMGAGHGGQILVGAATAAIEKGIELVDLGEHRLRGISRPQRIFQVRADGLPDAFPPLRTPAAIPGNLPAQVTSFIGRETEVEAVVSLVCEHRLVTLTGAGGVGKTRLAVHVADRLAPDLAGGSWLVTLASISDPASVPEAVAGTFGITQEPGLSLTESIARSLDRRGVLIILDSCEHVIDAATALAGHLLARTSGVRILATSREELMLDGEQLFPVPPLSSHDATSSPAVLLFVDRARLVEPGFSIDHDDPQTVREICERLDGIPLAIELAAARVRTMKPAQIRQRLGKRFRLLTVSSRRAEERHQTLRRTVQWSYDLLDDAEKQVLCRAAVFAGGFSLDAAEAVCAGEGVEPFDVLDLLDSLVRKSLVTVDPGGNEVRYSLLETIRQFGEERLAVQPGVDAVRDAHAAFFAEAAAATYERVESAQWKAAGDWFECEMGNLRAAFAWTVESGQPDYAADIHPAYSTYLLSDAADVVDVGTQPLYGPSGLITSAMTRDRILRQRLTDLGVEARFHPFLKGFDVNHFLRSGRLDAGVGGDMPALTIAAEADVAVTSLVQLGFSSIVAGREMPLGDLRGATVAYAYGSNAHFVLLEALESEGIDDRDMTLTAMDATQMPDALDRRVVDAFSCWEPFPALAAAAGHANAVIYRGITSGYFYFSTALVEARPAIVRELVAAGTRALLWMRASDANLHRAAEWLIDDAGALTATYSGGATPEAMGLTPPLIAQVARDDIVGLDSASQIPAGLLGDGGRLSDEFSFLQRIGAISDDVSWRQVSAAFDLEVARLVMAESDRYRLGEFSYSDAA